MEILTSEQPIWRHLMDKPRIYADLNGGWRIGDQYFVPLNSSATESDMHLLGYVPAHGLRIDFWTDDGDEAGNLDPLVFTGKLQFNEELQQWFAVADWNGFQHASELVKSTETRRSGVLANSGAV